MALARHITTTPVQVFHEAQSINQDLDNIYSKKKAQRRKQGVGVKGSERGQSRCNGGIKVESRVEREEGLEGPWVAKFSERCQVVHVLPHVSSLVCKSM